MLGLFQGVCQSTDRAYLWNFVSESPAKKEFSVKHIVLGCRLISLLKKMLFFQYVQKTGQLYYLRSAVKQSVCYQIG